MRAFSAVPSGLDPGLDADPRLSTSKMHGWRCNSVKLLEKRSFSSASTYKSEFFAFCRLRQAQLFNFSRRLQKNRALVIVLRQLQHIATSVLDQLARQHEKFVADRVHRDSRILLGQTQTLEPVNEIVCQQQQLQEGNVGHPTLCWNFVQRKILEQLSHGLFHVGSPLIGLPNFPRLQRQIRHEGRVSKPAHFQQTQLLSLLRIFGKRSPNHDEAVLSGPAPGYESKLGNCPSRRPLLKSSFLGLRQVKLSLRANNNIAAARLVQIANQLSRKESRIGQQSNPRACYCRRNLLQADSNQSASSRVDAAIARPQRPVPELLPMALEAQQRMIGRPSSLLGIVAYPRTLLFAIKRQDHRVEMEYQAGPWRRQTKQLRPQLIMQTRNLPNSFGREPMQKRRRAVSLGNFSSPT